METPQFGDLYTVGVRAVIRKMARTPQGVEKWIRASSAPERVGDRVIWHGYLADISLRKGQELKIRELEAKKVGPR